MKVIIYKWSYNICANILHTQWVKEQTGYSYTVHIKSGIDEEKIVVGLIWLCLQGNIKRWY